MTALLLLTVAFCQADDVQRWIKDLGDESIEVREIASRRLRDAGESVVTRLEKTRADAKDPDIQARLSAIVEGIRKDAEFAKVFGPTRRVTLTGKDRKLGEVLKILAEAGPAALGPGKLDPEQRISIDATNVTWWEALDLAVHAAGAKYDFDEEMGGATCKIDLSRGLSKPFPRVYQDQFRIGVVEVKKLDFVAPGCRNSVILVMIEALHQPNLRPSDESFREPIQVKSLRDSKGADARAERPNWTGGHLMDPRPLGLYLELWVKAEAAFPITLEAVVDVSFPKGSREVTIPVGDGEAPVKVRDVTFSIVSFNRGKTGLRFEVKAESEGDGRLMASLLDDSVFVVDSKGKRHEAISGGKSASPGEAEFEFSLEEDVPDAKQVVFKWVGDYHRIAIPFRLEGIDLSK